MNMQPQAGNPNMQAFMQSQQPLMPPQGMPQPPQGTPMQAQQQMPPQGPQDQPQQLDPKIQQLIQQLMQMGRGGDTLMAHLTPGEMEVPPEVQTPKVLATLKKAYHDNGVDPAQFTAGSPQSSTNPQTGLPEYNFMSSFLPAALGIAGSIAMPYLAPELMSATLASSIGAGVGTTLGGLASGQKPGQAILSGAGAGAGGYALGGLGSTAADAVGPTAMSSAGAALPASSSGALRAAYPGLQGAFNNAVSNPNMYQMAGSTIGGQLGSSVGAPNKPNSPNYPPGFNTPMTPFGQLPSYQAGLGQNQYKGPNASFTNFNPSTNYPASYSHFPVM